MDKLFLKEKKKCWKSTKRIELRGKESEKCSLAIETGLKMAMDWRTAWLDLMISRRGVYPVVVAVQDDWWTSREIL